MKNTDVILIDFTVAETRYNENFGRYFYDLSLSYIGKGQKPNKYRRWLMVTY